MPRPSKGARLVLRKRDGRLPVYVIKDGETERSTGTSDLGEAEAALSRYISERRVPGGPATAEGIKVGVILSIYGEEHGPQCADPARIAYAIDALDSFWGDLTPADVKGSTCRRYAASRVRVTKRDPIGSPLETRPIAPGTIRRELNVLQAALNHCEREGYLLSAPRVTLPEKSTPRERWLTRAEMYWLMRAVRHLRIDGRHLMRFILVGRYTGTRKAATLALALDQAQIGGGWVDTKNGVMYRAGEGQRQTKKRQPAARLPRPFLAHCRRWSAKGDRWVVQDYCGQRVGDVKKGWENACRIAEKLAEKAGQPIDLSKVTPHVLRHTAITWAMQGGAERWDVSGYFGVSMETLERVYGHHHPDHQKTAVAAMESRVSGARPQNPREGMSKNVG